jgi:hypothetical protein
MRNHFKPARLALLAAVVGSVSSPAAAEITTFNFARCGQSYSAAIFGSDPRIGRRVIEAHIVLDVRVDAPGNAADFNTDILIPVQPDPGNDAALVLTGVMMGWSGTGTFHHEERTTRFNGLIRSGRYGAESPSGNCEVLDTSTIELTLESARCIADFDDGSGTGTPDGGVTLDDLLYYLDLYSAGDAWADVDDGSGTGTTDGGVTLDDLLFFLAHYDTGC